MRILVIDDEEPVRALLCLALEEAGYDVAGAAGVDQGMAVLEERPADLIITDIFLPEADAHAKLLQLAWNHPGLRIIAISGAASHEAAERLAQLLGVRQILEKPFSMRDLLDVVRSEVVGPPHDDPPTRQVPSVARVLNPSP